jgi:hypothetical protein
MDLILQFFLAQYREERAVGFCFFFFLECMPPIMESMADLGFEGKTHIDSLVSEERVSNFNTKLNRNLK